MSDFRTIAIITETLRAMLDRAIKIDVGDDARATAVQPVKEGGEKPNTLPEKGVNIYLYHINPNPSWRNEDLPTRSSSGIAVRRPRLALDLHYLLTFYGADSPDFEPHLILGSVVRTLHSHPILTRKQIQETMNNNNTLAMSSPSPADEIELVKFGMVPLSLEELSKLWSVFFQNHYALSVVYHGSAVFIDGLEEPSTPLPVKQRNLYVEQFRLPYIEKVVNVEGNTVPIAVGSAIQITGRELRSKDMILRIGELDAKTDALEINNNSITQKLLGSNFTGGFLKAGIQGVQVIHNRRIGTPAVPHEGVESNIVPFVLHPTITVSDTIHSSLEDGVRTALLPIFFIPPVGADQRVTVMLTESDPTDSKHPLAYQCHMKIPGPDPNVADTKIALPGIVPGIYFVRVLVDGAESLMEEENDPDKPAFYIGPKVEIL